MAFSKVAGFGTLGSTGGTPNNLNEQDLRRTVGRDSTGGSRYDSVGGTGGSPEPASRAASPEQVSRTESPTFTFRVLNDYRNETTDTRYPSSRSI
mgnify:CR=1 FL=1